MVALEGFERDGQGGWGCAEASVYIVSNLVASITSCIDHLGKAKIHLPFHRGSRPRPVSKA